MKKSWQIADQESVKQVVNAGAKTLDTKTVGIGYITADNSEDHAHSNCRLLITFKILWAQIRSDEIPAISGSKLFDTLVGFRKKYSEKRKKNRIKNKQQTTKRIKIPSMLIVN